MGSAGLAAQATSHSRERGPSAIEAKRVTKIFGSGDERVVALDSVSVEIGQNEFFTLLGPSGCGKTTLLRLIAGFEHPSDGVILLHGEEISALPPFRRPVNTVFQNYALFPHLTVAQNIGFGLEMLDRPKAEIEQTVAEMLRLVRMDALANRRTTQLSGGQQQRVALARALAPRPKVLLLDEPLSALDLKLRKEMQIELKRLQHETGITFVFVTHDQEEALTMSDRLAVMSEGQILQVGAPRTIYDHPADRFVANFIGETNFVDAELIGEEDGKGRIRLPSGAVLPASLPDESPAAGKVNIVIRPEHTAVSRDLAGAALSGHLETVVYFGTDTHYHLRLSDGGSFIVRQQNTRDSVQAFEAGEELGIVVGDNAVQVLRD